MITQKSPKSRLTFNCEDCNYICFKISEYNKHILTRKHQTNLNELQKISLGKHICECGKECKNKQAYSAHKRGCIVKQEE